MEKIKEIRMTLVILIVGLFFVSGCFFNDNKTITFKTNGGSEVKNISVKNGGKLEETPVPTKDGYIFDGWYLDGQEYNFDKNIDEDITLVAKWIKDTNEVKSNTEEPTTEQPTEETTTRAESTTTKKVESTKSTKKKTTTAKKKTTKKTTTTTTTQKRVETTKATTTSTTKPVLIPDVENPKPTSPIVTPTEPITPPTEDEEVKKVDLRIEVIKEEKVDLDNKEKLQDNDSDEKEESILEYIRIIKTKENTNVISNIDDLDLKDLLTSDPNTWMIISNHAYIYEYITDGEVIDLKGDDDVTSLTVVFNGTSVVFDYDEVENYWVIKYPTVSVGTGLDTIYYSDLKTAISVAKENDTIKLLADQKVDTKLEILKPITIEGDNYKITNKEGFLFDLENIEFTKESKFEVKDVVLDVDSFIYVGKSKFDNIVLNNVTGNIKNDKIDKRENGEFENTNILQHF